MATAISVLKPGLLVSLKTSLRGGVSYARTDLEREHQTDAGQLRSRWETTKQIADPDEFVSATKARGDARAVVARVCCPSAFGLLCPSEKETELQAAIIEARDIVREHNRSARLSLVDVYVLVGRVAQDDAEAARAIGAEVRGLLEAMQAGIRAADPEAIREAANKARAIGGMLSESVAGQVSDAIKQARQAAREIVRRVENAGENAAAVVAELGQQDIERARFAFLDLDAGTVEAQPAGGREVEFVDVGLGTAPQAAAAITRAMEF